MNDNILPVKVIFYSEPDSSDFHFIFEMSN